MNTFQYKAKQQFAKDFIIRTGLKQRDPPSTLLFNVVLEKIIRNCNVHRGRLYRIHQLEEHAENVAIVARSIKELNKVTY